MDILHLRSNLLNGGKAKAPIDLPIGQLAINYKSGYESLFFKNDSGSIVALNDWSKILNKPTTFAGYGINDNINNISGNLYADRLLEPSYKTGGITNTARPLFDVLRGDRTAFLPAEQIIVEYSTDAGITWTSANVSDSIKRRMFTGQRPSIAIPLKNGVKSTDCMMRITVTGMRYNVPDGTAETEKYNYWNSGYVKSTDRYFSAQEAWMWISSNSDRIHLKIERASGANSTSWIVDREAFLTGWSGGNYVSMGGATFGGGTTQTGNFWNYRFTFRTCSSSNTFNDADLSKSYTTTSQTIHHIKVGGTNVWSTPNNYMYNDHLYSWDEYQNVTFPGNVTAASFIGNASTATKLATGRTFWGQSFDGSSNVDGSINLNTSGNQINSTYAIELAINYSGGGAKHTTIFNGIGGLILRAHSNGNVGIGNSEPQFKLDVNGSTRIFGGLHLNSEGWLQLYNGANTSTISLSHNNASSKLDIYNRTLGNWASVEAGYLTVDTITMKNNQSEKFIRSNAFGGAIRLRADGASAVDRGLQLGRVDNNLSFSPFMTIFSDTGNVNIGSTSDSVYKFTVNGASKFVNEIYLIDGLRIDNAAGAGVGISLFAEPALNPNYGLMFARTIYKGTHGAVNGDWATYFTMSPDAGRGWIFTNSPTTTGGNVASISSSGNLTCSGEITAYSASDKRLKTDIKNLSNSLELLVKLNPVSYKWNAIARNLNPLKSDRIEYGLIAQELESFMPELVHPLYNGLYKSIDYIKIIPHIICAIKQLKIELDKYKLYN